MTGRRGVRRGVRRGASALAAAGLVVGLVAGCSGTSAGGGTTQWVQGDGTITVVPEAKRQQPVTLRGTTLEGAPLDVASFRGKVVVVNVWGSWCPPCRKEAPDLQKAFVELKPRGVEFVGIDSNDKDRAQALAFQKTFGITYPSLADDGGAALLALRGAVAPNAVPTTLVLDQQGRVAARISSATTKVTLVDVVEDVLAGKAGA
jgi:thiol-disulfide isomerase/thioredoxin